MFQLQPIYQLVKSLDRDEEGSVSLETILILGAIAIPILIFMLKFGWPTLRRQFFTGLENLEGETSKVIQGD